MSDDDKPITKNNPPMHPKFRSAFDDWPLSYQIPQRDISGGFNHHLDAAKYEEHRDKTHSTPKSSIGSLETEESPDTIVAYKYGKLVIKDKELRIAGAHSPNGYAIDAEAKCHRRETDSSGYQTYTFTMYPTYTSSPRRQLTTDDVACVVPGESCVCGFYAYKSLDERAHVYGELKLQVELYGKVVVHERGMRASHQRVLKVTVPCCGQALCRAASTSLCFDGVMTSQTWRCDQHNAGAAFDAVYTLNDVAGMLGTEVQSEPWTPTKIEAA